MPVWFEEVNSFLERQSTSHCGAWWSSSRWSDAFGIDNLGRHLAKARENTRLRNATNQVLHYEFGVLRNSGDLLGCVPDAKASSSILTRKCSHVLISKAIECVQLVNVGMLWLKPGRPVVRAAYFLTVILASWWFWDSEWPITVKNLRAEIVKQEKAV